jgi:hypothetical protein
MKPPRFERSGPYRPRFPSPPPRRRRTGRYSLAITAALFVLGYALGVFFDWAKL